MKQLGSMNFDELVALKGKVEAVISSRVLQERKLSLVKIPSGHEIGLPLKTMADDFRLFE